MTHTNAWAYPSKVGSADVVQMAAFLEEHALTPDTQAVNQKLCDVIDPKPGECLLEVGSGSGLLCRLIVPQLQPNGSMVGIDISPVFSAEAQKYARQSGIEGLISF